MKNFILIFFITITANIASAQTLHGKWTDERDWHIYIKYVFDSSGQVYTSRKWDMGSVQWNGQYQIQNDSIYIQYRPSTEVLALESDSSSSLYLKVFSFSNGKYEGISQWPVVVSYINGQVEKIPANEQGEVYIPEYEHIDFIFIGITCLIDDNREKITYMANERLYRIDKKQLGSNHCNINIHNFIGWKLGDDFMTKEILILQPDNSISDLKNIRLLTKK